MQSVQGDSPRRQTRSFVVLVFESTAVSGVALTVGSLGAAAFFERGSLRATAFIAVTVILLSITAGRAVSSVATRLSSGPQPRMFPVESASRDERSQKVHSVRP